MSALPRLRLPTHPTPLPSPIDSIRDITGTEKNSQKPAAFKQLVELAMK